MSWVLSAAARGDLGATDVVNDKAFYERENIRRFGGTEAIKWCGGGGGGESKFKVVEALVRNDFFDQDGCWGVIEKVHENDKNDIASCRLVSRAARPFYCCSFHSHHKLSLDVLFYCIF